MPSSLSGLVGFNVPNAYLSLAGFEVTTIGRFWVTAEEEAKQMLKIADILYTGFGVER
jgi:hypothetical protein